MTDTSKIVAVRFIEPVDLRCLSVTIGETREVVLADPSDRYSGGQTYIELTPHPNGIEIGLNYKNKNTSQANHLVFVPFANIASIMRRWW